MGWAAQQRSTEWCKKEYPGWSTEGQHQLLHLQSPGFPAQLWFLWFWGHLFSQSQACLSWRVGFTVLTIKVTEDAARQGLSWRIHQSDSQLACMSDSPGDLLQNTPSLDPPRPLGVLQTEVISAVNEQSTGDYWMLVWWRVSTPIGPPSLPNWDQFPDFWRTVCWLHAFLMANRLKSMLTSIYLFAPINCN